MPRAPLGRTETLVRLAQFLIALARQFEKINRGDRSTTLTLLGVTVGQAQRREWNASQIAAHTGLPRSTVLRKLGELSRRGLTQRSGFQYRLTARGEALVRDRGMAVVKLITEFSRDTHGLSELDNL